MSIKSYCLFDNFYKKNNGSSKCQIEIFFDTTNRDKKFWIFDQKRSSTYNYHQSKFTLAQIESLDLDTYFNFINNASIDT